MGDVPQRVGGDAYHPRYAVRLWIEDRTFAVTGSASDATVNQLGDITAGHTGSLGLDQGSDKAACPSCLLNVPVV